MRTAKQISSFAAVVVTLFSTSSFADSADVRFRIGDVFIGVDIGPPPAPVVEYVPVAVPGHVWAPGYWASNGHRHVWNPGAWNRARPGYRHVAGHWEQRGGRWYLEPPRWESHNHRRHGYAQQWRYQDDHDYRSSHRRDGRREYSR
ncbi:MAG: YXWGXW repeat-containing protein [Betaproteobacteria bacterium]|nr:YXWGXW repeat-containing protein [Betaproteobacteria bacterium]